MRERNVKNICNHIFWLSVYLLPVIFMLLNAIANSGNTSGYVVDFTGAFQGLGIVPSTNGGNVILDTIYALFGNEAYLIKIIPAKTTPIMYFLTWITEVSFIRLTIQIITLIPKLTAKMFKSFIGGDENEVC